MTILFRHALDLAWTDGRLSRRGAILLENLQDILDLNDEQRSFVEEPFLEDVVPFLIPRGLGSGADLLDEWMTILLDLDEDLPRYLVSMGRQALKHGISRDGWISVYDAAESMGCGYDFGRGVWEPEFIVEILPWPSALEPVAAALGLLLEEE